MLNFNCQAIVINVGGVCIMVLFTLCILIVLLESFPVIYGLIYLQ